VEVLIAVSILVSCAHAWRPLFAGKEVWIALGFGLVHGVAFAEVLSGLNFDGTTLVLSLVGFNLGIESMQLLVIAVTLPLMLLWSATPRYEYVRVIGAGFAAACALGWILERAFGLSNPLAPVANWLAPPPFWFVLSMCLASAVSVCILRGAPLARLPSNGVDYSSGWLR
jgi:HupE / UreJ protein